MNIDFQSYTVNSTIIQDRNKAVLMLGYMNAEAYQK
jgi:phosphoribosyl-AMP cyclohydrolase